MWKWEISSVIGIFSLALFLIAVCYILYSGLTTEIHIKTGLPPVRGITIAYKYKVGLYKDCGSLFKESSSIGPNMSCIGIFYDDPKKVPRQKCRYAVGSVLSEGDERPNEEQKELYEKHGFWVFSFPEVTHVVTASFPHRTPLSIFLGVQRVYPQLNSYIRVRFEAKTCADSHSERSSMSRLPPSESRDTSPAPSSTPTRSQGDRQWDYERDFDHAERSESSSVSSFEELDIESDRTVRCDHTPPPLTGRSKNNPQGQEREMMVEEE
ncbi:putative testis-expressed sequence 264 protein-like [Triplophysa rosa]|uniref:Testis-expressed sequence 264 protein-like n=1 Tax=Triplophysa rosa TaxID=992332 RepID=A0A9W7TFK4_TRIRA|nr:putative testis-expressed sequence 264 protein-like [Triplophysa rosa]